jgi:hypothetical protein
MRSKTVLSIIAFVAAFGISVLLAPRPAVSSVNALSYQTKRCAETSYRMTGLLEKDIANGNVRDRKMADARSQGASYGSPIYNLNYAAAMASYSKASKSIETAGLPSDFRAAWDEHMDAWEAYAEFLKESIDSDGKITRERSFYRNAALYDREISRTWYKVLLIASENGAKIPAGAY